MSEQPAKQVIVVAQTKSVGIAILLTVFFGPLGMFYSTIAGAITMFFINLLMLLLTAGIGLLLTWPINIIWAAVAANSHNKKLLGGINPS